MPTSSPPSDPRPGRGALLRRADQTAVAVLLCVALAVLGWRWIWLGGHRGRLIDIDREPQLHAAFQVDINKADWPELAQLPGVGETLARRIVERRERVGPYIDNEQLREIRGIGPRTFERLSPYLRARPSDANLAGR